VQSEPFIAYPLQLTYALRRYAFGARRIAEQLGKAGLPAGDVAETWEVSDHPSEPAVVRNGPYAGRSLGELVQRYPDELVRPGWRGPHLPLLVKFLDASHPLPVHVHPDGATAARRYAEPNGKDEAWHIVWAAPGASVLVGLQPGVDRDTLREALLRGDAAAVMRRYPVQSGDTVDVPAGVLHSFGPDTLIVEVQETSDLGESAMPDDLYGRPLARTQWEVNVEATLDLLTSPATPAPFAGRLVRDDATARVTEGCRNERFVLERWTLRRPCLERLGEGGFATVTTLDTPVTISGGGVRLRLEAASSCLLSAAIGAVELESDAEAELIVCYTPAVSAAPHVGE